ncbi:MAG: NADH-quinone oxidoreductase subunit G, partial [Acetobacter sp.]|nr:NADH-quinone oxidoreductase subunit G [Acetobacter sp.]
SEVIGYTLPYDTLEQVRDRMAEVNPVFAIDGKKGSSNLSQHSVTSVIDESMTLLDEPFQPIIQDYYLTNSISRASQIMAECSAAYRLRAME